MKFIVFMIPKVYQPGQKIDPNFAPPADAVQKMMKYNEELTKGGHMIALDGLHPLTKGARVAFTGGGKTTVTDGPYIEAKEVVGGYWILQFKTKEEAIDWVKKCPAEAGDVIEIRPIYEFSDFPEDVQKVADSKVVRDALKY